MGEMVAHGAGVDSSRVTGKQEGTEYFLFADRSDRTKVMAGIRQHPLGARRLGEVCSSIDSHVDRTFLIEVFFTFAARKFLNRGIMNYFNQNSARILASRKECYAQ